MRSLRVSLGVLAAVAASACAAPPPVPAPVPVPAVPTAAPTPSPTAAPSPTPTSPPAPPPPLRPSGRAPFALVVSFGSECCGTDQKASAALDAILARYPRDALGEKRGRWGKEGEFDACFTLAGLSAADRKRLVDEVRAGVARKLVEVTENAACHDER
jgi:hypothetical protein